MNKHAFLFLKTALNMILMSVCSLIIYIDSSIDISGLIHNKNYIAQIFAVSLLISFCGTFIFDFAIYKDNIK